MSPKKETAALVGVGAVACVACCSGPILAVLAAIGLGTAVGFALYGIGAIVVGAIAIAVVLHRRRRRAVTCDATVEPVAVDMPSVRTPR